MTVDARDWLDSLGAAWRSERLAARAKVAMERSGRMLAERVALGVALANVRIVDERSAPGERIRVRGTIAHARCARRRRAAPMWRPRRCGRRRAR